MTSTVIYIPLLPRYQTKNTKLRTNTGHQSTQQHQQQRANLANKNMPPILLSACSPIAATAARTRDYTASLLLSNKRVRRIVHGGCCCTCVQHGSSKHASPAKSSRTSRTKPPSIAFRSLTNHINYSKTPQFHCPTSVEETRKRCRAWETGCCTCVLACTCSAITRNPRRCRHRHIGNLCLHPKRSAGRRNWQSTVCRNWPHQQSRERGKKHG